MLSILLTPEHRISAAIENDGRRLIDVLNDTTSAFLHVQNASVYHRTGDTRVATVPDAVLRKSNIALAIPAGKKHEAPQKRYDNFTVKRLAETFLILLGYEIQGHLSLQGANDPVSAMQLELATFFAVSDARLSFKGSPPGNGTWPAVIVNSAFLSLFRIGDFQKSSEET